jgi:hypothetical protein
METEIAKAAVGEHLAKLLDCLMVVMTINWYGNDKEVGGEGNCDFLYICALGTSNQLQKLYLIIMPMKHLFDLPCRHYVLVLRLSESCLVLINSESCKF